MSKERDRDAVIAEIIRLVSEERKRQGISMNKLAEKTGLSQSLVSSLESGPWNPTIDSLLRMTEVLDVNLGDIIKQAIANIHSGKAKTR